MSAIPADFYDTGDDYWTLSGPDFKSGPTFNFGDVRAYEAPSIDAAQISRNLDRTARMSIIESDKEIVTARPVVTLDTLRQKLASRTFHYTDTEDRFYHFPQITGRYELGMRSELDTVLACIRTYRICSFDTEGKSGRIAVIVGDFDANVLLFNDISNLPIELIQVLEDVRIFKVQSAIHEDFKIAKEFGGITMRGLADSAVIYGCFLNPVTPDDLANSGDQKRTGTGAQAIHCGRVDTPFRYNFKNGIQKMNFQTCKGRPNQHSIWHCLEDGRQPIVTLMSAAVLRAESFVLPVSGDHDSFSDLWDILVKVSGVPIRVLAQKKGPMYRTVAANWFHSKISDQRELELNSFEDVKFIQISQKAWPLKRKISSQVRKKLFTTQVQKKAKNTKNSDRWKTRMWFSDRERLFRYPWFKH